MGGKLTAKLCSVLSVNIFLVLGVLFGLHHAGKVINLITCHHKIQNMSKMLHLEGDRLFFVSMQMISLW